MKKLCVKIREIRGRFKTFCRLFNNYLRRTHVK